MRRPWKLRDPPRPEADDAPGYSGEELAAQSMRMTQDLLTAMGFEAKVSATVDGDHVDVTAEVARDEELLTGRKGEVRQALQHILNRIGSTAARPAATTCSSRSTTSGSGARRSCAPWRARWPRRRSRAAARR